MRKAVLTAALWLGAAIIAVLSIPIWVLSMLIWIIFSAVSGIAGALAEAGTD